MFMDNSGTDSLSNHVNLETIQLNKHAFIRALGLISVEFSGIKTHQKYDIILHP